MATGSSSAWSHGLTVRRSRDEPPAVCARLRGVAPGERPIVRVRHHAARRQPEPMSSTPPPSRRRRRRARGVIALVVVVVVALGGLAVATDTLGAGRLFDRAVAKVDRFLAGPVPDRATGRDRARHAATGRLREPDPPSRRPPRPPPPGAGATRATADADARADARRRRPSGSRSTSTSRPTRPAIFASEVKDTWCSPAGVQMTLAVPGQGGHLGRLPARAPGPGPRVGELRGQPQRRLGTGGDGAGARGLWRPGLRGPGLPDPRRTRSGTPRSRSRRPARR